MFEEKESFWKKKGFYFSACVLLVCVMAVGAIFYRKANFAENESNMMANIATEVPSSTASSAGNSAISSEENTKEEEVAQANAKVAQNITSSKDSDEKSSAKEDEQKEQETKKTTTKKQTTNETAKKSDSEKETQSVSANTNATKHSFDEEKGLLWPVNGDVILKYSMNNAIYFKTLAQYKCNPGIAISAKVGTKVKAAADCSVTKIEKDDELGTVVTTDIGNNYKVSYGQLDNISVNKGDELKEGDVIGTIAKPTKYYTEEGSNLYFMVVEGKETVDPLLLLR